MNDLQKPQVPDYKMEGMQVLGVAFELGFIIALPIVLFAFLGKWLDRHFHHSFYIYVGIVLALTSSVLWIYARLQPLVSRLQNASKLKKDT